MDELVYKKASTSATTDVEKTRRKEVRIASAPVCWDHKVTRAVISDTHNVYANRYSMDGTETPHNTTVSFMLGVRTDEFPVVKVHVQFDSVLGLEEGSDLKKNFDDMLPTNPKYAEVRAAAAKMVDRVSAKFFAAVNRTWNGRFKLEITDPACGVKIAPIVYNAVRAESYADYTIVAYPDRLRAFVQNNKVHLSRHSLDETHVHEFGHCIGLPDEYSYSKTERALVKYIKPDGSLDAPIVCRLLGDTAPEAELLMSSGKPVFHERHAWPIAIEVQKILSEQTGRKITCRVLLA